MSFFKYMFCAMLMMSSIYVLAMEDESVIDDCPISVDFNFVALTFLDCDQYPTVDLFPNFSGNTSTPTFQWAGPNNFSATTEFVTVDKPGIYSITVTDAGNNCSGSASVEVTGSSDPPIVDAGPDQVIGCPGSVILVGTSNVDPSGSVSYEWSSPFFGTVGFNPNYETTIDDTYTFTVTDNETLCSASDEVVVTSNFSNPTASIAVIGPQGITCVNPTVTLDGSGSSGNHPLTYSWTGPNNFSASTSIITVSDGGTYELTVSFDFNGCSDTRNNLVFVDMNEPLADAGPDKMLTCTGSTVILEPFVNIVDPSFMWTGPNGFTSTLQNPQVSVAGNYTMIITDGDNGCTNVDDVVVTEDFQAPTIDAGPSGTVTCAQTAFTLSPSSSASNSTYEWTFPNGSLSTAQMPMVTEGGIYILTVTDQSNGCTALDATNVFQDNAVPVVDAGSDQVIICNLTSATLGGSTTSTGSMFTYQWTDETGAVIGSSANITVSDPGVYTLQVNNTNNGCFAEDVVEVECSCIENLNITANPIPSGTFKAVYDIETASLVPANGVVTFKAGNMIKLNPGFEVKNSATFNAIIEVCQ